MTQIIIDKEWRSKLHDLTEPLELCDETGKLLARLFPVLDESLYEKWEPATSKEELDRIRKEPDYSTEELLAHLKSLPCSE
jgi:hypothetical protein